MHSEHHREILNIQ